MARQAFPLADQEVTFGAFGLLPAQQLLLEGDTPLQVGSRALSILGTLVDRAGEVVSKEELVAKVWPDTFVEEGNLRVHVAALRRILRDGHGGNRFLATIPGRGYSFVARVSYGEVTPEPRQAPAQPELARNPLPAIAGMVGRDDVIAAIARQIPDRRFVTLVGPGGIGKTTVAAALARRLSRNYRDGASFADLAPISNTSLVPSAVASGLGLAIRSDHPGAALMVFLKSQELLLVLDNCEHVIEAAANLAEDIFKGAPGVHILATSREPLRAAGERVHRLPPLESAPPSANLTAAEALKFAGIQLFVDRASAVSDAFELTDADAPVIADICRRLDGIPLAIELAAGRIDAFGVRGLAERLDDRFRLLTGGRRTALPRHQTLSATLDWSYELLPAPEQTALRRLGIFAGDFSLASAAAVASERGADIMAALVTKSLIAADLRSDPSCYRLLDTTRIYCLEKLRQSGEYAQVARQHAEHVLSQFKGAVIESERVPKDQWLATYERQLGNLRSALDWAFSERGDIELGVALTIAAVPLWAQLSLVGECRRCVERALATRPGTENARYRMQLSAALGWSLMFGAGTAPAIRAAWTTTRELAEQLDDMNYRLGAMWGLWVDLLNMGAFRKALALAWEFNSIVQGSTDSIDQVMADRLLGKSYYFLGEQRDARKHLGMMFDRYLPALHQTRITRFQFDQGVTARYFQARVLWLLGFPEQAMQIVEANIEEARTRGHALTLSSALGQGACPIALFVGDLDAADRFGALLLEHSERHALDLWHAWARCFAGVVAVKRGNLAAGLPALQAELAKIGEEIILPRYLLLLGELAVCLGQAGRTKQALEAVDGAIARCERNDELWCIAELFRVKGELLLLAREDGASQCFQRALAWAQRQGTLSWELRAATSLVRCRRDGAQAAEARELLARAYARFSEGFETADLKAARALIAGFEA